MKDQKIDESIDDFILIIGQLLRKIRAKMPGQMRDFTLMQKGVLSRLEKNGPATAAELARLEGVKPQSMGVAIASLEEAQLIKRIPIQLTDAKSTSISQNRGSL